MKKILLSLFTFVATTVAAPLQATTSLKMVASKLGKMAMPLVGSLQLQPATPQFHRAQMLTADSMPFW